MTAFVLLTLLADPSWRLSAGVATEHVLDDAAPVVGYGTRRAVRADVERKLFPALAAYVGVAHRSGDDSGLELELTEMVAGASVGWPRPIVFSLTPYARGGLLLGYADLRGPSGASDQRVIPGVEGAGGLRFGDETLFAYGEGSFGWRRAQRFALDSTNDSLAGPRTPVGTLGLTGWGVRFGLGIIL